MKKFISELLKFSAFFIIITMSLIQVIVLLQKKIIRFDVPSDKTVIVLGNSHPECAINDNILKNVVNFSCSGESYFYSYLKLRKILSQNPQIHTVVLGYSYGDIAKDKDAWFNGAEKIKYFMPKYLFLFSYSDFYSLFISNPWDMIIHISRAFRMGIQHLFESKHNFGGYRYLKRDKLEEAKKRLASKKHQDFEYSKYQKIYLLKIYHLINAQNINLTLLNVPIHPLLEEFQEKYKNYYYSFAEELSKAKIVNHSNIHIPEYGFGDLGHLNYKGSELYSEYLKNTGFYFNIY